MFSGNGCESLFQCAIGSGGIDKQYIKPEQAEEGNDDQYDIGKCALAPLSEKSKSTLIAPHRFYAVFYY